jgi:integrase
MHEREPQISYVSALAQHLHRFVAEKRALGCRYQGEAQSLIALDRFLTEQGVTSPDLPKTVVEAWTRRRPHESVATQQGRLSLTRQLCLSLIRQGFAPYLPGRHLLTKGSSTFVPYVFTQAQIRDLFAAADQIRPDARSPRREVMLPLIFRLLYGCGLRVSEALRLQLRDVDLGRGILTIREAKFRKDRLVPMAPSLVVRLRSYAADHLPGRTATAPFFPAPDAGQFHQRVIHDVFRQLLWACGISYQGRGKGPRLHDLRHTFAVHRLMRWYREGTDLGAALPVLSAYLGHVSLQGTQRYLRLSAELHPDLLAAMHAYHGQVIPGRLQP